MQTASELLTRIAALRSRLGGAAANADDDLPANSASDEQFVQIDTPLVSPTRLTFRAAQLLKDAKATLAELRTLADEVETANAQNLQREAAGLLDLVLRNLLSIPSGAAAQLRHCEGLQTCLAMVREKMHLLTASMADERREDQTIELLATYLRRLVAGDPVEFGRFAEFAHAVADDALDGKPLRFRAAPKDDVARFAACHGLAVARVQAWAMREQVKQRQRLAEAIVPALVHDVGMLVVPAEVVFKTAPLDADDRRAIQQHARHGIVLIQRLYPGGGWPVEAIADHHERLDGTGYPAGKTSLHIGESARLLAACDVYAALVSPRPFRAPLDPRTALADTLMLAEQGRLDRTQSEKLLRLSFYPPGTVVRLSDGAVALVVGVPRGDPSKGTVVPLRTAEGRTPPHPWPIDLADANSPSIVRALTASERAQILGRSHPSLV